MRTDANGDPCPATLGEYRAHIVTTLGKGENNLAVQLLDKWINLYDVDRIHYATHEEAIAPLLPLADQPIP